MDEDESEEERDRGRLGVALLLSLNAFAEGAAHTARRDGPDSRL